ncbi:MAG: hypothetical protein ACI9S8_002503 [Chlamydiales bacterium]
MTDEDVQVYFQKMKLQTEDNLEKEHIKSLQVVITYLDIQKEIPGGSHDILDQVDLLLAREVEVSKAYKQIYSGP